MTNIIECIEKSLIVGNLGYENVKCDIKNSTINFDLVEYPMQTRKSYRLVVEEVI